MLSSESLWLGLLLTRCWHRNSDISSRKIIEASQEAFEEAIILWHDKVAGEEWPGLGIEPLALARHRKGTRGHF